MKKLNYLLIVLIVLTLNSCYYDNLENLKPETELCHVSDMSFQNDIQPIFNNHCIQCHNGPTPPAGFNLEEYSSVIKVVESGRLLGAIKHQESFIPMPFDLPQLDSCNIAKIESWINDSYPNN